ncbi:MAG: zinc ribbon domain-containing protein [Armatimonadota bacterium]
MRQDLKLLYKLQLLDIDIANTQKALKSLDGGAPLAAQVAQSRKSCEAREAELRQLRAEIRDAELTIQSLEDKRRTYRLRLSSGRTSGHREQEAIQKEIDMLSRQIGELEEKALLLMDAAEPLEAEVNKSKAAIAELEGKLAETRAVQAKEHQRLSARLQELLSQRAVAAAEVPQDLLRSYDAVRSRVGPIGVSPVQDGVCSACKMTISTFSLRHLREGQEIVECDNCRRILYLPEGS